MTPTQSPAHIFLDVISISLLTTPNPSIVLVNNDLNWKDAPTLEDQDLLLSISSLFIDQSRFQYQPMDPLTEAINKLADNLSNRIPISSSTSGTKAYLLDIFSSTDPNKLNNFLF